MHGVDDEHEVLDELHLDVGPRRRPRRPGSGPSRAGRACRKPSSSCRRPARGGRPVGRCERSMALMLSRPRKPPANRLSPSGSIRLTHQVKFISSFGQQPGQEVGVASAVDVPHVQRRPGMHGRVHVAERPLVGGQRAVGVSGTTHGTAPAAGTWRMPGRGVRGRWCGRRGPTRRTTGTPMGRASTGCPGRPCVIHAALRPQRRSGGGGGWVGIAVEPALHVVAVELLAPDHPGEGLAGHEPLVVARRQPGSPRRRTRRPPGVAVRAPRRTPRRTRARRSTAGRRRTRTTWVSPGATVSRYHAGRLRCRRRSGFTVGRARQRRGR